MSYPLMALDALIVLTAMLASYLWLQSSRKRLRRVSRFEEFDHHDFNRIVISLNRMQILSARAALATGATTLLACIRLALDIAP